MNIRPLRYHPPSKQIEPGKGLWVLLRDTCAWLALWSVGYGFRELILAVGGGL